MKNDWRGLVSIIFAIGIVLTLLVGIVGVIWRGKDLSDQAFILIGILTGAIVGVASSYLGVNLTYRDTSARERQWPRRPDEDTLVK